MYVHFLQINLSKCWSKKNKMHHRRKWILSLLHSESEIDNFVFLIICKFYAVSAFHLKYKYILSIKSVRSDVFRLGFEPFWFQLLFRFTPVLVLIYRIMTVLNQKRIFLLMSYSNNIYTYILSSLIALIRKRSKIKTRNTAVAVAHELLAPALVTRRYL